MPSEPTVTLTTRVPESWREELAELAEREHSSVNREVKLAIRARLDATKEGDQ